MELKQLDARGLIADAYLIDGIDEGQCRSIFLDWAIGLVEGQDARDFVKLLHAHYAPLAPDHPMSRVLAEGMGTTHQSGRRGGRKGRVAT